MQIFLKNVFIFFLSIFCYLILMYCINLTIIQKKQVGWENSKVLIAGGSHTQRALNPKLFHSAINISQEAEPYCITYWKLKKYLSQNNPDLILLGFSYHNLSSFNDEKFSDKQWDDEMFKRIYAMQNFSLPRISVDKHEFYEMKFHLMCLYPRLSPIDYKGEYSNSNTANVSDSGEAINRHFFYNKSEANLSKLSAEYLDSITLLCKKRKIELAAIATPTYHSYYSKIPEKFVRYYTLEKNKLSKAGVVVLDFSREKYPDNFYLNADHLNAKGAEKFTEQMISILSAIKNNNQN
jgi:hypothetical protein